MREKWESLLRQWKGKIPLPAVLVLAVGCLLLLIPSGQVSQEQGEQTGQEDETFALEQFERRLEQVLSRVEGAGEVRVVLALSSSGRRVLAQDRQQDGTGASTQTITIGSSANQQVVPVQTLAPVYRGALVVSSGAADARVRLDLTRAVAVLTGLGTDCICVTTGTS